MRALQVLAALFLTAKWTNAHPHDPPIKRAVSPDGSCGGSAGYTCPSYAPCCSQWGYCGSSADYCAAGCQARFGTCNGTPPPTSISTSTTSSSTRSTTSSSTPSGVQSIPRPHIGNVPYGTILYSCVNNGDVALTFDDGPYIYTPHLLDVLKQYNVKATFFIVGSNGNGDIDKVAQWTDIIKRTYAEGHQVASHTWDHADLTTISSAARKNEMYKNEEAFLNILGFFPTYMRPPYLACGPGCKKDMSDLGYHIISTNLDTKDYENDDPTLIHNSEDTFNQYISVPASSASYIVLNHDIHQQTAYVLAEYEIQRLQAQGYRAVTVGECLGDPASNWYRKPAAAQLAQLAIPAASLQSVGDLSASRFPPPSNVCTWVVAPKFLFRRGSSRRS